MNGYHIIAYDLTTAQDGGSEAFANPSVRVGKTYHNSKLLIRITIVWDSYMALIKTRRVPNYGYSYQLRSYLVDDSVLFNG